MKIPEKYRKWLTRKAWFNCFRVGVSLLVIAWLFEFAHTIVFSEVNPIWLKTLYSIGMAFLFGFVIWLLALLSPELMETIFAMLGYRKEEKTMKKRQTKSSQNHRKR
jgi:uncharacterized membrane protein YGL010W